MLYFTPYVMDVFVNGEILRKSGPCITRSNLLIANKIDSVEQVDVSLKISDRNKKVLREAVRIYQPSDRVTLENLISSSSERGMLSERPLGRYLNRLN